MACCWKHPPHGARTPAATPAPPLPGARYRRFACLGGFAALAATAVAAHAQASAPAVDGPSFLPMAVALVFVLGLIGAALWLLRRTGLAPRAGAGPLRVVTQLALGPRERVVIIEVGERWWLLGVGAGGVTRLGSVPKGEADAGPAPVASFGALLDKLRGGTR